MRLSSRVFLALAWLLVAGGSMVLAQPVSDTSHAPTGHVSSEPPRDRPVKPPVPERRQPIHQVKRLKTPVVAPHGRIHPHKVVTAVAPAKVEPPAVLAPPPKVAPAAKPANSETPEGAAEKLPRFVSLRSDDVNMRVGPGTKYPIEWVYKRRDLPVEIERQFEVWRWVRDADGVQGWVHEATLMGRRTFIVEKADATLRSDASDSASAVAILQPGVVGRIRSCEAASAWCNVQAGSYRGFLRRTQFWGVLPDEAVNP